MLTLPVWVQALKIVSQIYMQSLFLKSRQFIQRPLQRSKLSILLDMLASLGSYHIAQCELECQEPCNDSLVTAML